MNPYLLPVVLPLRPSRRLATALLAGHCGSLLLLPLIVVPAWLTLILIVAVLSSLYRIWRRLWFLTGDPITELVLLPSGEWRITSLDHRGCSAHLLTDSVVHPQLTVLCFKLADGRRRSAILTVDNTDPDAFRRLRVRLRFLPLSIQPE
jgi:hypothetical protein